MGGRRNPRCLVEPLQKLKNRKAEADQRRGRPHPGHQGALHAHARAQPGKNATARPPLTSNLPVPVLCSLSAMRLNPQEPTVGAAHALCFAKLKSPHSYLFTRTD